MTHHSLKHTINSRGFTLSCSHRKVFRNTPFSLTCHKVFRLTPLSVLHAMNALAMHTTHSVLHAVNSHSTSPRTLLPSTPLAQFYMQLTLQYIILIFALHYLFRSTEFSFLHTIISLALYKMHSLFHTIKSFAAQHSQLYIPFSLWPSKLCTHFYIPLTLFQYSTHSPFYIPLYLWTNTLCTRFSIPLLFWPSTP